MKQKYRPLAEAAADKIELGVVLNRMLSELHASHVAVDTGIWFATGINYVRLGQKGEQWVVRNTYAGSPAKAAGIERGWLVTEGTGDCDTYGRKVTNTFQDKQGQQHKTEIPCEIIPGKGDPLPLGTRILNRTTVYLQLSTFNKEAASWFKGQVAAHRSAAAIVIDLRANAGGITDALLRCLDLFFSEKTEIGTFRRRNGSDRALKVGGGRDAYRGQVFVLTNESSFSASEIFAAVMQETQRGTIVGRTTGGAVLGANSFKLPSGFGLNLALSDFHTAKGTRLEGRGVIPDEPVAFTVQDFQQNKDPDLARVLALLAARK
jgi:C-terminal processing protease CtpA/Prc